MVLAIKRTTSRSWLFVVERVISLIARLLRYEMPIHAQRCACENNETAARAVSYQHLINQTATYLINCSEQSHFSAKFVDRALCLDTDSRGSL